MPKPIIAITATSRRETAADPLRVRLNQAYVDAVAGAGGVPLITVAAAAGEPGDLLDATDGLLLTGGEDLDPALYGAAPHPALGRVTPDRDRWEIALVRAARERQIPVFGVCRGIQVLGVALGGTLIQHIPAERRDAIAHEQATTRTDRSHPIAARPGSRVARLVGEGATVNSMHHQAIARSPDGLAVTATAPDGIVEAVEWTGDDWWALGVQWHPEELDDDTDSALFAAFIQAAAARSRSARLAPDGGVGDLSHQPLR